MCLLVVVITAWLFLLSFSGVLCFNNYDCRFLSTVSLLSMLIFSSAENSVSSLFYFEFIGYNFKGCLYHGKFFFLSLSIIVDDFAESVILGCFTLFGLECFVQVPQSFQWEVSCYSDIFCFINDLLFFNFQYTFFAVYSQCFRYGML